MKSKIIGIAMVCTSFLAACKSGSIGVYADAAKAASESKGDQAYDQKGEQLKIDMIKSLAPLKKRIKLNEGLLGVTGSITTASGAAGTVLSKVITTTTTQELVAFVSSIATTIAGGFQTLISKTDAGVEYFDATTAAVQDWEASDKKMEAYNKLLTKAEALHDSYKRLAKFETEIMSTDSPKKVKTKDIVNY